ncbi:hypothetical protein R1T16_00110 [Flavobacterium sp. DG1-102-2]|uniref:hypothetical protein n=1 Tax=Flavobacterium sp. DG1-102-2 TaxID=3081663 RepID=UPI002949FD05|nr:hypothetical protein [Flavobacterium sp. DG1-102-2]MDV6166807.1 hypothetical protein [Flavobacterium sp. DG1-102-2]
MKKIIICLLLGLSFSVNAQKKADKPKDTETPKNGCDYTIVTGNDGQELKSTKEYLMYEKVFAGTSQFMFFSLTNSEGVPILNFQLLAKSKEFPKSYCIDSASKIYIQLNNGKIVTLISATEDQCSGLVYDSNEKNNLRILTGTFLFTKGSLEDLEKYDISFIRVKYVNETVDYPVKKELDSESMKKKYYPEAYFINTLKCIQ